MFKEPCCLVWCCTGPVLRCQLALQENVWIITGLMPCDMGRQRCPITCGTVATLPADSCDLHTCSMACTSFAGNGLAMQVSDHHQGSHSLLLFQKASCTGCPAV